MKHLSTFVSVLSSLVLIPMLTSAQIVNAGFETWTNNLPDGWYTFGGLFNDVSKSAIAHSGSASLKATVVLFNNVPTGALIQSGQNMQGFPVSARHASISGYYQFSPVNGDQFVVGVVMYAGAVHSSAAVGGGDFTTSAATGSTWAKFTVPITYIDNTTVPQNVYIQIAIAGSQGSSSMNAGSYYLLDDLTLDAPTAVSDPKSPVPHSFALAQNYPNPFNPSTMIQYSVPKQTRVTLTVYNVLGQAVRTLVDDEKPAGTYSAVWNGKTDAGTVAGSGIYFCSMRAGEFSDMKRMMLLK